MTGRSIWAVVAGVLFVVVVTTIVDVVLHLTHVYPGPKLTDGLAVLATSYRLVITVAGAWLTARLAPSKPMKHAMILGAVGVVLALVGFVATRNMDLGPKWYSILLIVLALPQCWAGGKIHEMLSRPESR